MASLSRFGVAAARPGFRTRAVACLAWRVVAARGKETSHHSTRTSVLAEATTATSAQPRHLHYMH